MKKLLTIVAVTMFSAQAGYCSGSAFENLITQGGAENIAVPMPGSPENAINEIKAVKATVLSNAGEKAGRDSVSASALKIIGEEFQLPGMKVLITEADVRYQTENLKNKTGFEDALRLAMKSFLEDNEDPESPLALMIDDAYEVLSDIGEPTPSDVMELAREMCIDWLNRPSTFIELLGTNQVPEGQESVFKNWIFSLRIPEYSDHLHWAVVDRSGVKKVYNYGFN